MWVVLGKADEPVTPPSTGRKKKRKTGNPCKNREDSESRRRTHIAVERKRRKQMNDYLATLRSLVPLSHIQRASIVGGSIDFIKELEQLVGMLQVRKQQLQRQAEVEVEFGQSHVNLRVLSPKMPGHLRRAVTAMEPLHFSILQLNVISMDESVLYSFNVKVLFISFHNACPSSKFQLKFYSLNRLKKVASRCF